MMANDWKRLNIWLATDNHFDYVEFSAACKAAGTEPQTAHEFAQKAGMVTAGMIMYPELSADQAYLKFINENRQEQPSPAIVSRGLGDTVAKITHATGLDKLATLYTQVTGKPCGCASRQEALNKLGPYGITEEKGE
jgi:hypothetical protein